eukprot:TRINITY_DN3225_c0_g4_i1.p1 TRINITY_DN3225_c0_g4~~TRINITY_DN3225_c0_g4_i1.p1  ORF type:complete len:859 (-),score=294.93 TRINITY_DN3225_c0_g4_i1:969-3545(-)
MSKRIQPSSATRGVSPKPRTPKPQAQREFEKGTEKAFVPRAWFRAPVTSSPPKRSHFACAATAKDVFLFGGLDANQNLLNDMWRFNLLQKKWQAIVPTEVEAMEWPSPRKGHSLTRLGRSLVMFGGDTGSECTNEVWIFDTDSMMWSKVETEEKPFPRYYHCCAPIDHTKLIVYAGGSWMSEEESSPTGIFNDLWVFDLELQAWVAVPLEENNVEGRVGASMSILHGRPHVFGGRDVNGRTNTIIELDLDGKSARVVNCVGGEVPSPRSFHVGAVSDHRLVIFGGHDGEVPLGDMWIFDSIVRRWQRLDTAMLPSDLHIGETFLFPGPRTACGGCVIPNSRMIFIGGGTIGIHGTGISGHLNDFWLGNMDMITRYHDWMSDGLIVDRVEIMLTDFMNHMTERMEDAVAQKMSAVEAKISEMEENQSRFQSDITAKIDDVLEKHGQELSLMKRRQAIEKDERQRITAEMYSLDKKQKTSLEEARISLEEKMETADSELNAKMTSMDAEHKQQMQDMDTSLRTFTSDSIKAESQSLTILFKSQMHELEVSTTKKLSEIETDFGETCQTIGERMSELDEDKEELARELHASDAKIIARLEKEENVRTEDIKALEGSIGTEVGLLHEEIVKASLKTTSMVEDLEAKMQEMKQHLTEALHTQGEEFSSSLATAKSDLSTTIAQMDEAWKERVSALEHLLREEMTASIEGTKSELSDRITKNEAEDAEMRKTLEDSIVKQKEELTASIEGTKSELSDRITKNEAEDAEMRKTLEDSIVKQKEELTASIEGSRKSIGDMVVSRIDILDGKVEALEKGVENLQDEMQDMKETQDALSSLTTELSTRFSVVTEKMHEDGTKEVEKVD